MKGGINLPGFNKLLIDQLKSSLTAQQGMQQAGLHNMAQQAHQHTNLTNAQSSTLAAQQMAQSGGYRQTAVVNFGEVGSVSYMDGDITDVKIFGTNMSKKEFKSIDVGNSALLQFDGENFKIDGKIICKVDDDVGAFLVGEFAKRCLNKD